MVACRIKVAAVSTAASVGQLSGAAAEQHPQERGSQAAQPKEQVQQVQHRGAPLLVNVAGQRVGGRHDDAAAEPEQEQQCHERTVAAGAGQRKQRDRDQCQPDHQPGLLALVIDERTGRYRRDDQTQRLSQRDVPVLRRRQAESRRQARQRRPEHGGDHAVHKDGENGSENQARGGDSGKHITSCLNTDFHFAIPASIDCTPNRLR